MNFKSHIIFRVDGNKTIGLGHLSRCLSLARGVSELGAGAVAFATRHPAFLSSLGGGDRFPVIRIPPAAKPRREMELIRSGVPSGGRRCVVFDIGNVGAEAVAAAREFCELLCTVDDRGRARGRVDLIFNTVIDGLDNRVGRVGGAKFYGGARYIFLPPEIREARKSRGRAGGRVRKILVAMGGSDPQGLTPKAVEAARDTEPGAEVDVIVGGGFSKENVSAIKEGAGENTRLVMRPRGILPHLAESDLGVTSGGVTLTEMAAVGVPAVVLSQGRFAHGASLEFEKKGCCIVLGRGAKVSRKRLRDCIAYLMEESGRRREMSRCGRRTVDGRGIYRVGKLILEEMRKRDKLVRGA